MSNDSSHVPHSFSVKSLKSVKWDGQVSHRFTTLRSTLQHSLITHSLHPSSSTAAASNSKDISLLSIRAAAAGPLRSGGQYGRSQSDAVMQQNEQHLQGRSGTSGGAKRMMLPPSNHNNNSKNTVGGATTGFPFGRSISYPLTPDVPPAQKVVQHPQPLLFGRSASSHVATEAFSTNEGYSNHNNITAEKLSSSSVNEEGCIDNQFHAQAIRALLSDTPLPLLAITSSSSNNSATATTNHGNNKANNNNSRTIIQPRQPKQNEHIYLLPRVYMRKWSDWVRNDIIISSVDHWLVSSLLSSHYCTDDANNVNGDDEERVLVFELSDSSLQSLAALSIIADQYQLYSDDDDNDGNEDEWTKWLEGVQLCWNDWMTCVNERGWLLLHNNNTSNNNNNSSSDDGGRHSDEKKEDMTNHNEGVIQASQLFRDMLEMSQPLFDGPPGPIDARLLSQKNKPLQLRRCVSLMMRGITATNNSNNNNSSGEGDDDPNESILTVQQEMSDEALIQFLDTPDTDENAPHLAVSPVPSSFYNQLRQTLGVFCEDGRTVSFQPLGAVNKNGSGEDGSSLLYHDLWKRDVGSASGGSSSSNGAKKNMDIHYPSSPTGVATGVAAATNSLQQLKLEQVPRPIEFRRRLLPSSLGGSQSTTNANTGSTRSYAELLKEATQSKKDVQSEGNKNGDSEGTTMNSVEVYPIEFHYSIIDGVSSPLPSAAVNANSLQHCQRGMALASQASVAKTVLHELEHAASPGQSSACIRLWMKSRPYADVQAGIKGATKNGDGFDLIDMDSLVYPPAKKQTSSNKSPPRSGKKSNNVRQLTVGEWLRLDPSQQLQSQTASPIVVELLIEIRSSPTARWTRESLELENRLQVGDFVDAQDSTRQWYEAIVREVTPDTVKVHYFGWGSKWDTILPRRVGAAAEAQLKSKTPPMPLWTKTTRWREHIKVGDEVEVRESSSLVQRPKWHRATVLAVGRESDPPRELVGGAELEALDDNDYGKKVPLLLLNRKRQILVEVPQERLKCTSPLPTVRGKNDDGLPAAQPPFIRWVNLYSEEICQVNTHKTSVKQQTDAPATASYVMESKRELVEVMKPFNNIHGSGFVRESLRGNPIASGTIGLHNLGNSCYMNSILQCLNQIKPITSFFLKGEYLKEINKNNPLGSGGRISTAYTSFLNDVWGNEYSILAPRLLKQTVGSFAPQFNNNFQHDSHEFCQFLMDGLHEDLNRVKNKPYVEQMEAYGMEDRLAAEESWRNHLKRHDSIFVDYTQGMHRSHLTCPGCGRESVKFDVYSSISLPLVPPKSGSSSIPLKDCLDQFAAGEQLDEHNAWYCANCKRHVCALKLINLWNTPDILILHLKRFTFEECPNVDGKILRSKIEDTVNFPIDRLDMTEYIIGPVDPNAPPIYKLFGVSEHSGTTANSGHYTATVRNCEDGNWYKYNDSNVGFTSGDAAITGGAYLLFYQRIKGSLRWAGMEKELNGTPTVDEDGFQAVVGKKKKNRR